MCKPFSTSSFNSLCLPSKRGQIFLQHVMPPWLVYWPNDVSKKKRGMPQENRNSMYGTKKAPSKQT